MTSRQRAGLTLIDVLVVAVIAAVLAAVVVPQLRAPAEDDRLRTAEYHLATMRGAVETYRNEHQGLTPAHDRCTDLLAALTVPSRDDGTIDPTGECGPYLPKVLENPFTGETRVRTTDQTRLEREDVSQTSGGWLYNPKTGQVFLDSDPGFDL